MHRIYAQHHRLCLICGKYPARRLDAIYSSHLQWTDYFCSFIESDLSWRVPLFVQCIIGSILALGTLILPESPRFVPCQIARLLPDF